jgi:hypothetical protein
LEGLEGAILIDPSPIFWEHGAFPNRTTSLDHQSHNRNKYDLWLTFMVYIHESWTLEGNPKGKEAKKTAPSNQIQRVKNNHIITKQ